MPGHSSFHSEVGEESAERIISCLRQKTLSEGERRHLLVRLGKKTIEHRLSIADLKGVLIALVDGRFVPRSDLCKAATVIAEDLSGDSPGADITQRVVRVMRGVGICG